MAVEAKNKTIVASKDHQWTWPLRRDYHRHNCSFKDSLIDNSRLIEDGIVSIRSLFGSPRDEIRKLSRNYPEAIFAMTYTLENGNNLIIHTIEFYSGHAEEPVNESQHFLHDYDDELI